jgi:hypothetical protein
MNCSRYRINRKQEAGIALLMSILILLLVSVLALSMLNNTGVESSLAGNYRSSTSAYYGALAGLEEARGRLVPRNPNYFNKTVAGFLPNPGAPLAIGQVRYILNPSGSEVVAPLNFASAANYPDNEYATEFGLNPVASNTQTITSTAALVPGVAAPPYKWVRITPATERSISGDALGRDVNNDGVIDNTNLLYYDNSLTPPQIIVVNTSAGAVPPSTAQQVYKITALVSLPGGTERLLQYTVAPKTISLSFPSALTFGASNMNFNGASSNPYIVDGTDGTGNPPPVPGCTPNPANSVNAVGAMNSDDVNAIISGIPSNRASNYTGAGGTTPDIGLISLPNALSTPASTYQTVQNITSMADVVINGDATQADLPSAMSASNPMTVVVNGNFSMTGNFTGYGLLVVTGNFTYSGTTGWKGVVLVAGDGTTTYDGLGGGNNEFDGAIYVATIWDASHNILPSFGAVNYDISGGGGNGVYFNSCWINNALQPSTFQVLSFREIPYND